MLPVITIRQAEPEAAPAGDASSEELQQDTTSEAGSDVPAWESGDISEQFYSSEISDELFATMYGKSFKEDCTLPREDLRYLHVLHKTIEGETMEGELVVNFHIADQVLAIFRELYENDYPIEKIRLIDVYDADDERSMADNNTSCFNYRLVSDTNNISKHGRGLAIDLNPFYNPYVRSRNGETVIEPAGSDAYADRAADFPYKIDTDDLAYRLFTQQGFTWGGSWKNSKDYQHFEVPAEQIKIWYPE
ncbi:MAG: M15 family metallopeptidase [Lachnospiraceae bacterium]|nr:M15 family metallopeptidase [Lachnospiraceae bacterium]